MFSENQANIFYCHVYKLTWSQAFPRNDTICLTFCNLQILEISGFFKILKTSKISEIIFQNLENSKINPTIFHTIWPKNGENYGSLFFAKF